MEPDSRLDELQKISDCRLMTKMLKKSGGWSIAFGALAVFLGYQGLQFSIANAILMGIGGLMVVEGLSNVIRPTPAGVLTDGISFLVVAGWNVYVGVLELMAGMPEATRTFIFVIVGISIAVRRFNIYPRFKRAYAAKPTAEHIAALDRFVNEITKATSDEEGIVEFQTKGFTNQQNWKGTLRGDVAVLLDRMTQDLLFLHTDELEITSQGKKMLGKTLNASFRLKGSNMKGTISPESLQKYERWKQSVSDAPAEPSDAGLEDDQPEQPLGEGE